MLIAERHTRLKELIARRGMCDLKSLSAELAVSHSTVRRDIEQLEQQGLVKQTHGGVIWVAEKSGGGNGNGGAGGASGARPYAFDQRMGYQLEAKRLIARAARELVQQGETILIDGGTTTFFLAEELLGRSLQLVTNSLPIANLFLNDDNVELILTGGLMYPRYGVLLGPGAESMLAGIHTKTLFLSVAGVHDGALYNQNLLLVQSERRMMEHAQQVVLLADATKFGQQALAQLGKLDEIDVVVTDGSLSDEHGAQVRAAGCELIIAK
jgi:DeoR/GlpR family transcriptional regulator of sugar metabolism